MAKNNAFLTIGETAQRSGVAASALRFYETRKLVASHRGRYTAKLDRVGTQAIATIKVFSAVQVKFPVMPVAGKNAVCGKTTLRKWVTLMRATIIAGAYAL